MSVFQSRWGLGSRRKATIDISLLFIHTSQHSASHPTLSHNQLVAMALACSWSVLSLGLLGCGLYKAHALDSRRYPTLAPRALLPRLRQEIKGLQYRHTAAASTVTGSTTICWSLLQHLVALPQTSRRCHRSTTNTRLIIRLLLVSFFQP